jgi:hypothetical protein
MNNINHNIREVQITGDFRNALGFVEGEAFHAGKIPYSAGDVSCGIENEFQTAVNGSSGDVDLAIYIKESRYLKISSKDLRGGIFRVIELMRSGSLSKITGAESGRTAG